MQRWTLLALAGLIAVGVADASAQAVLTEESIQELAAILAEINDLELAAIESAEPELELAVGAGAGRPITVIRNEAGEFVIPEGAPSVAMSNNSRFRDRVVEILRRVAQASAVAGISVRDFSIGFPWGANITFVLDSAPDAP